MLSRFYARIYHPLIYVGYGLEFGLLGMVAEGKRVARPVSVIVLISVLCRPRTSGMPPR